ncbi:helix-turn-helix domain-containing protein [Nocardia vulneris]|uniref:helix-turn-helix domain-containing protein n=1 Tax=Nocardia vulneris TaxID=1141657 RepID=UPI0030D4C4FB
MQVSGISVRRIVDDLGATLIELRAGDLDAAGLVRGTVIFEAGDDPGHVQDCLVLAVGIAGPEVIAQLVPELAAHGAAALVVRSSIPATPALDDAVRACGLPLIALRPGATWEQLTWMVRSLAVGSPSGGGPHQTVRGVNGGDLFALANLIGSSLNAPVTVEDRDFNVLAFSARQDEADESRIATILRRRVPAALIRELEQEGILAEIYGSSEPVHLPADTAGGRLIAQQRVVVAIRAGTEVLGAIWVAVDQPLDAEQRQFLEEAARLAALHLLALRAGSDLSRSYLAENVFTALSGGNAAAEAMSRLRIGFPAVVVAVTIATPPGEVHAATAEENRIALYRVGDAFATHLTATSPRSVSALVSDTVYAIVPVTTASGAQPESARRIAQDFVTRSGARPPLVIGIGPVARNVSELSSSRDDAGRALRVLTARRASGAVAFWDDLAAHSLLLDLGDLVAARGDRPTGAVARLQEYDAVHQTELVHTLELWLEAGCDLQKAAVAAFVHPNTFRYRLKRVSEVGGLTLEDADDRFFAHLQLRLLRLQSHSSTATNEPA